MTLPVRLSAAVRTVRRIVDDVGADALIGFGGYVALPAYFAARGHTPYAVHEANARAGLANRIGARWAGVVAEAFPGSLPQAELVGTPLRPSIATLDRLSLRREARAFFGLDPSLPTLLVMGGSQGARRINEAVLSAAPYLPDGMQVLHAVGPKNESLVDELNALPQVRAVSYLDRVDLAYAAADLALCRAGAMTCAEIAAVGLPAVLVPYAVGNGEQALNARPLVESGGALIVADADVTADVVLNTVVPMLSNCGQLGAMSLAMSRSGVRNADERLVDLLEGLMKGARS